jgi:hypothetical protein
MDKKTTLKKIDDLLKSADELVIQLVKDEARKILKADDGLHEFIMAMGGCFFTLKDGGKYDDKEMSDEEWEEWTESDDYVRFYKGILDDKDYQKEFFDMVDDLNNEFKVCGYPVRFTATSQEVYDWGDTIKDPVVYVEDVYVR